MIVRGIDTLEFGIDIVNYESKLRPLLKVFKTFKEEGQNTGKVFEEDFFGVTLTVEKSGMPFYSYRLTGKDFIIGFTEKETKNNCQVTVRFLSGYLWSYGYKKAYDLFMKWFSNFDANVIGTRLSRLDICVDTDEVRFVQRDLNHFVTRAKSKGIHFVSDVFTQGRKFSGLTIGRGQPIMARIYLKSEEIKRSGKVWFIPLWEELGWRNLLPVWRVEFQLRRDVLKELGIDSVEDIWGKEDQLWAYLTESWLQLKEQQTENVSRDKVKRKWRKIQSATSIGEVTPLIRQEVKKGDVERLFNQANGLMTSIAAAGGFRTIDQTLMALKGWGEIKLGKEGLSFETKVNSKRKKFLTESALKR